MAKQRRVDAEELLIIERALRDTPGLEDMSTTVTDRALIAIRSATGHRGSATASYTLRASGCYQMEIFASGKHFNQHGEIKNKHTTDMVVAHIQDLLIDYLNGLVGA